MSEVDVAEAAEAAEVAKVAEVTEVAEVADSSDQEATPPEEDGVPTAAMPILIGSLYSPQFLRRSKRKRESSPTGSPTFMINPYSGKKQRQSKNSHVKRKRDSPI